VIKRSHEGIHQDVQPLCSWRHGSRCVVLAVTTCSILSITREKCLMVVVIDSCETIESGTGLYTAFLSALLRKLITERPVEDRVENSKAEHSQP